jgi:Tfp pilus assembly protein PilX
MSLLLQKHLTSREGRKGFALVIVLAFVVLLTMVAVAFFSNAVGQSQVSSASADQVKVKLLADGAVDTIVCDLKQEIADPANSLEITDQLSTPPADSSKVYLPARATAADPATAMVPRLQGVTHSADPLTPNGLENLIKISSDSDPFYPGASLPVRASSLASNDPTQDRPVTPAKWNLPLFLEGTSDADNTPTAPFPVPHWIYVSTDGADPNPKAPGRDVVGRYAYTIYNEGGLLDINAAGFPITGTSADAMGAYRTNMGFVDLTKLKGGSDSKYSDTALFDASAASAIVGWRNYVSAQASGSGIAGYGFSTGGGTAIKPSPYFKALASNAKGFLQTANTSISGGLSDHLFVSRQQLIDFLRALGQQSGGTGPLLASLQYLTTFSRALEQPTFSFPGGLTGAGLPVAPPSPYAFGRGGNDQVNKFRAINSSFVKVRAASSFNRIDGTTAMAGEPLLKKRFPLSRLEWLTYDGPSAGRTGVDITHLKELGVTAEYLAQGTAQHVQGAFGLTWDNTTKRWTYMASLLNSSGHIRALGEITGREPNFFELLKASINVGSLAKPASNPTVGSVSNKNMWNPADKNQYFIYDNKPFYFEQSKIDASVDLAIMQLGANIIDQADADGWPTQIEIPDSIFTSPPLPKNNGQTDQYALSYRYPVQNDKKTDVNAGVPVTGDPYVVTGVENLPYIFRVSWSAIRLVDPKNGPNNTISETGLIAGMLWPEIWNPHGYDPANVNALGDPRPKDFTLAVRDADALAPSPLSIPGGAETLSNGIYSMNGNMTSLSSWKTAWGFDMDKRETFTLGEARNKLSFTVPDNGYDLFREPTLLNRKGFPDKSNLDDPVKAYGTHLPSVPGAVTSSGIHASATSSLFQGGDFIGFYLGAGPAKWVDKNAGIQAANRMQYNTNVGSSGAHAYPAWVFTLKASDGTREVRYDTKRVVNNQDIPLAWPDWLSGRNNAPLGDSVYTPGSTPVVASVYYMTVDPRTSRWNFMDILTNDPHSNTAIAPGFGGWGTPSGTVLPTYRFDSTAGTVIEGRQWHEWNLSDGGRPVIFKNADGWTAPTPIQIGYFSENKWNSPAHYADADKIIRRAAGGYSSGTRGLPLAKPTGATPSESRPIILNRPFRSVAELGVVFSGTPWKNLNFSFAESGDSALLDVFCVKEVADSNGLVAGKFNLNTSQRPVVKAIVEGAYQNELSAASNFVGVDNTVSDAAATAIVQKLVKRTNSTSTNEGPFTNVADLVGYYTGRGSAVMGYQDAYQGFGKDIQTLSGSTPTGPISRYAESAVRALANTGQTRVWNLMIDVVAQTGKFPAGATKLARFAVDGERRYWVHLAIDRFTGKILDKQVEMVRE